MTTPSVSFRQAAVIGYIARVRPNLSNDTTRFSAGLRSGSFLLSLLFFSQIALSQNTPVAEMSINVAHVDGQTWQLDEAKIALTLLDSQQLGATVAISELRFPEPIGTLRDVVARCPALNMEKGTYSCDRAEIVAGESPLGDAPFTASIKYDSASALIRFSSEDLPFAGSKMGVDAEWSTAGWQATVRTGDMDIQALLGASGDVLTLPENLDLGGQINIELDLRVTGAAVTTLDVNGQTTDLFLANEAGTLAAEGLTLSFESTLSQDVEGGPWAIWLNAGSAHGEAYAEPVYLNLDSMPADIELRGSVDVDAAKFEVEMLQLNQPGALVLSATGDLAFGGEETIATLDVEAAGQFPGLYDAWLKGFLVGTPASDLATSGALEASVTIQNSVPTLIDLTLSEFNADDSDARFAFFDANGAVYWRDEGESPPSKMRWGGGFLYGVGYGAAETSFETAGERIALTSPMRLPLLDGALVIETFNASDWSSENPSVEFDAELEPLDLRDLTTALGWPAFGGSLAGKLPLLRFREGIVTLSGSLEAQAFDGNIRVEDLRIQQPFSNVPIVSGSVFMEGLDLRQLTEVFTVGHIEGRLDGYIKDLQVVQAKPVAFDASFHTPPGDRSKKRISRRALDNLSEVAGGGAAFLSSPFLKFFENFSYKKLGISCQLANSVCQMGGVGSAPNGGYYLVQGSFVPRIDVIGHSAQVNWPRMVAQIEQAMLSGEDDDASSNEESQ